MAHRLHPGAPLFPTVTPAACSRSLLWAHPAALRRARPLCVPSAAASAAGPTAAESPAPHTTLPRTPGRFASALDPATYTTMLEQLQDWAQQYGSCYIPGSAADPRAPALAAWLKALRGARRAGALSQAQQQQLEELGVAWKPNVLDAAWHHQYHLLRRWVDACGSPQALLDNPPPAPPHPPPPPPASSASQQSQQQQQQHEHQEQEQGKQQQQQQQQQQGGGGATPSGSTLTAKEVYDLYCWLTRQAELYRLVKLTPLKTKLLRAAGVRLRRPGGTPRPAIHPLLSGEDPATYRRRIISVSPVTPQGRAAVGALVAQYRAAVDAHQQQQQKEDQGQQQDQAQQQAEEQHQQQVDPSSSSNAGSSSSNAGSSSSSSAAHPATTSAATAVPGPPLTPHQVLDPQQQPDPDLVFLLLLAQLQAWRRRYGTSVVPPGAAWDKGCLVTWVTGLQREAPAHLAAQQRRLKQQPDHYQQQEEQGQEGQGDASHDLQHMEVDSSGSSSGVAGTAPLQQEEASTAAAAATPPAPTSTPRPSPPHLLQPWQYQELSAVPFDWQPDPDLVTWHDHYHQLRGVKARQGHPGVSPSDPATAHLAAWLEQQLSGQTSQTKRQRQLLQDLLGKHAGPQQQQQQQQQQGRPRPGYVAPELPYAGPHVATGHPVFRVVRSKWLRQREERAGAAQAAAKGRGGAQRTGRQQQQQQQQQQQGPPG